MGMIAERRLGVAERTRRWLYAARAPLSGRSISQTDWVRARFNWTSPAHRAIIAAWNIAPIASP